LKAAVFLVFGFVSAQLQGFQTCAFAKTSPKTKNPRSATLHHFCQCSKERLIFMGHSTKMRDRAPNQPEFKMMRHAA
jgi:hypothetical protein